MQCVLECLRHAGAALLLMVSFGAASAVAQSRVVEPSSIELQLSAANSPGQLGSKWQPSAGQDNWAGLKPTGAQGEPGMWYRVSFELPKDLASIDSWALYLPYLYDGGHFWLNGQPLTSIAQTSADTHLRWERPRLIAIADRQLLPGHNELLLRSVRYGPRVGLQLQHVAIGPALALLPIFDLRMFWVRTLPQFTVATCLLVGTFVAFVWWRRRAEVLYGLFGLAAVLWGLRTLNFVIEAMPASWWPWWRTLYHSATGGFVILLALFVMRFATVHWPRAERALIAYWLIGPVLMLASGGQLDAEVGLVWTAGLIPIGVSILFFSAYGVWVLRTAASIALLAALLVAVAAGLHDYLVAWDGLMHLLPWVSEWFALRIFLLHHAAILLLLVMMSILALRFVKSLDDLSTLNLHLKEQIGLDERELAARLAQVTQLEREQAAGDERRRIMQDLHDGLGSQMFTSLARVERGAVSPDEVAQMLRACIADLRLTFELLAPDRYDFAIALGNFRFRWEALLGDAGIASQWRFEELKGAQILGASAALHVLRIAQEALTNVLKHARPKLVTVTVAVCGNVLSLVVKDDGCGIATDAPQGTGARGLSNMKNRAQRLGAELHLASEPGQTTVTLTLPMVDPRRDASRRASFPAA